MALVVCNKLLLTLMWLFRNLLELGDMTELSNQSVVIIIFAQPKFEYLQQYIR